MKRLSLLGATSQIARDVVRSMSALGKYDFLLYSRRPEELAGWIAGEGLQHRCRSLGYAQFAAESMDAIINCVGAGDPARVARMGREILDVTAEFDALALGYVRRNPRTRYIFFSSGAVYGREFPAPATAASPSVIPINAIKSGDYYAVAKLYAEVSHRSCRDLPVVDLRLFNYFSRSQDLAQRFFVTDILRAIARRGTLRVSGEPMVRDFIHPRDFVQLLECLLEAEEANTAVDCYSKAPITKTELLELMKSEFGLSYSVEDDSVAGVTGSKSHYYSVNYRAADFGYAPVWTSRETLLSECGAALSCLAGEL